MKHKDKTYVRVKHELFIAIGLILVSLIIACTLVGVVSVNYVLKPQSESSNELDSRVFVRSVDETVLFAKETVVNQEGHLWTLLIHSYRTDHDFMNPYAKEYQERGYNTLQPDNRAHGNSEGKYIGMGYLDQYDILSWIDYIVEQDPEAEIVLHGVSMGGAALMMLSGQEDIPSNVKVIIEDCGYVSAEEYLTWKLKQRFSLPAFPILPIANVAFKMAAGYYMEEASAIEGVKNSSTPTLFIHGDADETVPVEGVYRLYEAASCPKRLYVVEGAGHGGALYKDEEAYWNEVFSFIDKNMTE